MDILPSVLLFLALLFFFILSFFISGGEVSLFSLGRKDIEEIQGNKRQIKHLKRLTKLRDLLLATILLINNFANIAIVMIAAYISKAIFKIPSDSWIGMAINVILVTSCILVFGEIIPKAYAQIFFKRFSLRIATPLYYFQKVLYPFSWLLYKLSSLLLQKKSIPITSTSLKEFNSIIDFTKNSQEISDEEKSMLEGIQSTIDIDCHKIMTPKVDIFGVSIDVSFSDLLQQISSHGYSRIPIYKDSIDDIRGILYVKDLLNHIEEKNKWQELIKEVDCIPKNKKIAPQLREFLSEKKHMAIVVNELGVTEGLITLEDVVEEIVGEIHDEFDTEALPYSVLDENTLLFDGKTSLIDFCKFMNLKHDFFGEIGSKVETLAGLILEANPDTSSQNKTYSYQGITLTIEAQEDHQIKKIRVFKNSSNLTRSN